MTGGDDAEWPQQYPEACLSWYLIWPEVAKDRGAVRQDIVVVCVKQFHWRMLGYLVSLVSGRSGTRAGVHCVCVKRC